MDVPRRWTRRASRLQHGQLVKSPVCICSCICRAELNSRTKQVSDLIPGGSLRAISTVSSSASARLIGPGRLTGAKIGRLGSTGRACCTSLELRGSRRLA